MAKRFVAVVTRHKGVHFRSRLEACWSEFFDLAGIPHEYEPKDEFRSGWWPDFRFDRVEIDGDVMPIVCEVKPVKFDPINVNPAFSKAIGPDWVLLLGLRPRRGFIGYVARNTGDGIQTCAMTLDSERGIYGAPLNASTSALPADLWRVANENVTPAGVSQAINKGIIAHMGKELFHFWRKTG